MTAPATEQEPTHDHDVVVVGGGPTGCSAGIYTARYGLDTMIFDRGRSSIRRCAYLENYPGFPAGIDIETFCDLLADHAERAGCAVVSDLVESVEIAGDSDGFVVETQEGRRVTARRVIAATRYGGEYLRGLDTENAMFESLGTDHERFDIDYADRDGTTPVDGLFVASPSDEATHQSVMAAGRGARVGLALVAAVRRERGYPDSIARRYDWTRRETERTGEWSDRERWREYYEGQFPENHDADDQLIELREREIDRRFDAYISHEEMERRSREGQKRLLEHIDDELVLEAARDIETGANSTAER